MFADMLVFALMAMRYKYVEPATDDGDVKEETNGNTIQLKEKQNQDWYSGRAVLFSQIWSTLTTFLQNKKVHFLNNDYKIIK